MFDIRLETYKYILSSSRSRKLCTCNKLQRIIAILATSLWWLNNKKTHLVLFVGVVSIVLLVVVVVRVVALAVLQLGHREPQNGCNAGQLGQLCESERALSIHKSYVDHIYTYACWHTQLFVAAMVYVWYAPPSDDAVTEITSRSIFKSRARVCARLCYEMTPNDDLFLEFPLKPGAAPPPSPRFYISCAVCYGLFSY